MNVLNFRNNPHIKKVFGYFLGDVLNKAIPLLTLPYVANSVSETAFGSYSMGHLFLQFSFAFCVMGVTSKVILDVVKDKEWRSSFISSLLVVLLNGCILLSLLFTTLNLNIFNLHDLGINDSDFFYLIICGMLQSFFAINLARYQAKGNVLTYSLLQFSHTVLYFSLLIIVVEKQMIEDIWALLSLVNATVLLLHGYCIYRDKVIKNITFPLYFENMRFALFQLPHVMSSWLRLGYDRLILASQIGLVAVAGYSAALQIGLTVSIIVMSFNKFWSPFILKRLHDNKTTNNIVGYAVLGLVILCVLCSLLGMLAIEYLLPESYKPFKLVVPIICMAYSFQGAYFLIVNYLHFFEKSYLLSIPSVLSVAIHVCIAPILIGQYQSFGAAYSLLTSWFLLFLITFILVKYHQNKRQFNES